ncbi:imidazolonepropionase-like amidohydrolase [Kineococcus radiotolerans]|uniref:Imidazolonepropionase-like amidohydrolase n=1 Tax=Kineococcus radiotolerans TaxID=131568 RepID=A0A7W4TJ86_KINRA|nr:amidohydrolase family protein [Kineococcus radiotolerans]MBB2899915.1 imidazolonepropionase-like amidohydrolase [Kineococcus radiotolerans]
MTDVLHLSGPLLVGPDEVVGQAWVVGGRLTLSRPAGASTTTLPGWVLPGLVDAHCHVGIGAHGRVEDAVSEAQALADRDTGALLLRDAGSASETRWIDDREDLPRIVRAGRHLARTRRYLRGLAHEIEPEDLVEHVRVEARRGDGWVKLVGDWIDRSTGDLAPCWPADVLAAGVAAAHEAGARVTVHQFGEDGVEDLLAAGVDGIEHGTGLRPEVLARVAAAGIAVVPTLVNIATFPSIAARGEAKFPAYAAHVRSLHARRYATVAALHESGVAVFAGTDAGSVLPHGLVVDELHELVAAGLPVTAALDAGCWAARRWLGHPGLVEGASADLLVLDGDPRADLGVLRRPRVVLRGRLLP